MDEYIGQQLGNYRLIRLLGRGGFADVYLGEHLYLKSAAALKLLRLALKEEEAQHFLEEAQTLVRLRHTHIVRVLDFAIEGNTPVLIMDYIPGGSLRQQHPYGVRIPVSTVVNYVGQIASALQYAHNRHIIHRDVKPENILLDANQRLVLSDFGLALLTSSPELLSTQQPVGTLSYIAPEQIKGKPCFASDQYALGIVAYEWLTGERPFSGRAVAMIQQHLSAPPPSLRERCPDLPAAVEEVVLRTLAKNPRDRYVSIAAFAHALEQAYQRDGWQEEDTGSTMPMPRVVRLSSISSRYARSMEPTLGKVFLSAAQGDEMVAARLASDLKQRGILFSNEVLEKASYQEEALREGMRNAQRVVVVVTSRTRSSRLIREHLQLAHMYQRQLVLVWMEGGSVASLLLDSMWQPFRPMDVVDARGERYQTALEELIACLQEESRVYSVEESTRAPLAEPRNPYKGLRAFRQDEGSDFFGREAVIEAMIGQIKSTIMTDQRGAASTRLLSIVGPSGSGKSSVLLAGLLPKLQQGALPGSDAWFYLGPIVPGIRPLESLAALLAPHFPDRPTASIYRDLQDDSTRGLHRLCTQLVPRDRGRVVLVIDQFEEVFTQTISQEEQRQFIDVLMTAVTEVQGPTLVLLTLRADFTDRLMHYPHLYRLIEAHQQPILPMDIHELRQVIEQPAFLPDVQLTLEGTLAADLLFEAQGQVGALPLLEFTLDQLFRHRDGHTLTMAAYQELGGVKGALTKHAEAVYASLPTEEHRSLTRTLFLRLINPGASEQDTTRRRAALSELEVSDSHKTAVLKEVAQTFIDARLLTTTTLAGVATIEVSHETLIREWDRLSSWINGAREDSRLQKVISEDAAEWRQHGEPADRLYRGSQLAEAQAWVQRNLPSVEELRFLKASYEAQKREEFEERARQAKELTLQRQARRRQRYVIGLMTLTSIVLIVALTFTRIQQSLLQNTIQQLQRSLPASVTNTNDSGPGSLREAIATAKPESSITFKKDLQGTIRLTREIDITRDLFIIGPAGKGLSISGQGKHRIFRVLSGAAVTMLNLTLQDGFASNCPRGCDTRGLNPNANIADSDEHVGGAILNGVNSTLNLINVTVTGSTAGYGAVFNNGKLTLFGSPVSGNKTSGVFNASQGTLTLKGSTISENTGAAYGGGINSWGSAWIFSSTIANNAATYGGGMYIPGVNATATLENSTISSNTAMVSGGGICSPTNGPDLIYVTVYENRAGAVGGGIAENAGEGCGNNAPDKDQTYAVGLDGSIVAGDSAPTDPDIAGNVSPGYTNLIEHLSSGTHVLPCEPQATLKCASGKQLLSNVSPGLGPLHDNGGPAPTHALLANSPARSLIPVNASDGICGNPTSPYLVLNDERGEGRPHGAGCDLGAYQAQ